ncbi:MAG: endolytic transglycosylase MltG [bacterium]|nr:endolytic transglycosylase MltG [bacterium]
MINKKYLVTGLILLFFLFLFYLVPGPSRTILVQVREGDTFHKVARTLKKEGMVRSELFFIGLAKLTGSSGKLKTGTYEISSRSGSWNIIRILTGSKTASKIFTIPEGYNTFQIAGLLEQRGITSRTAFLNAVKSRKILDHFKIDQMTAEGFLYPETYYIPYEYTAEDIVMLMMKSFFSRITPVYIKKIKEKYGSLEKGVNLASLVEWEAKADFERPIIAGVFLNRLNQNLNLGSCATVLYALNRHKERLLFKDLKINSPYNTYVYQGLPPTPICNPSEKSILAVIYPARDTYLYFVSMNNGRHYFSTTYGEHLQAYRYYILGERVQ